MFPNIISLFYCFVKSSLKIQGRLLKIEVYIKVTFKTFHNSMYPELSKYFSVIRTINITFIKHLPLSMVLYMDITNLTAQSQFVFQSVSKIFVQIIGLLKTVKMSAFKSLNAKGMRPTISFDPQCTIDIGESGVYYPDFTRQLKHKEVTGQTWSLPANSRQGCGLAHSLSDICEPVACRHCPGRGFLCLDQYFFPLC